MKFDVEINSSFDGNTINYGIIKGDKTILFIKSGLDGSLTGYENKYLKIAKHINKKYGSTVICSSNPSNHKDSLSDAINVIDQYCENNKIKRYEIYYMGFSNGGLIGAWYGYKYSSIKKMLLINAPLMFNWHKTREGLSNFSGEKIIMIHGSLDQSIGYTPLLDTILNRNFEHHIVENEDHYFSKGNYNFIDLPSDYLYNEKQM